MDYAAARQHMIESQIRTSKVTDEALISALAAVPRELFVPDSSRGIAYIDRPVSVGAGRWLTEPMVLARLIQIAEPKGGDKVLVVGGGAGYAGAVLAQMVGTVTMLESDATLIAQARAAISGLGLQNLVLVEGPLTHGHAKLAPYDVILIDGGVEQVPTMLTDQLSPGGRLVTVVLERGIGRATVMQKRGSAISSRIAFDAAAPLLPGFEIPARFVF